MHEAFDPPLPHQVVELSLQEVPRRWMVQLKNGRVRQWVEHFLYTPLRKSLPRHVFLTLLLVGLTAVIGVPVENLELVLAITVSAGGQCRTTCTIPLFVAPLLLLFTGLSNCNSNCLHLSNSRLPEALQGEGCPLPSEAGHLCCCLSVWGPGPLHRDWLCHLPCCSHSVRACQAVLPRGEALVRHAVPQ